ncbi:hypothetical protein P8936_09380 [Edaphobacter paludis]|uniref:Uncharacterized protein n=1 Tax=Edaphobacter paludis TaxID=3035702 RepID=A0AAU7CUG8_9BACT
MACDLYGGKTSVVIVVATQSGLGTTTPHGAVTASYGTFGDIRDLSQDNTGAELQIILYVDAAVG